MANLITSGTAVLNWLRNPTGSAGAWDFFEKILRLIGGDAVINCSPSADIVSHSTFNANPVTCAVTLQTTDGFIHDSYDGPVTLAVATTSSGGTVIISPTAGAQNMASGVLDVAITGSGTWSTGTEQVETATLVGTVTAAGNASVTVTAAGMTGSPKTYAVPVALNDTPSLVAGKIAAVLAADPVLTALYTVTNPTGAPTTVVLTATSGKANDSTLNVATSTGTATGITTEATSANTTAGVAADTVTLTVSPTSGVPVTTGLSNATCVITLG
jgi:hypothetical protein